jgi:hypothetical protein
MYIYPFFLKPYKRGRTYRGIPTILSYLTPRRDG